MPDNHIARKAGKSKWIGIATQAPGFDTESFLTSVGAGRSSVKYRPKEIIFRQGDAADAVFYIEKGGVQLTVVSEGQTILDTPVVLAVGEGAHVVTL